MRGKNSRRVSLRLNDFSMRGRSSRGRTAWSIGDYAENTRRTDLLSTRDSLQRGRLRRSWARHIVDGHERVHDETEPPVAEGENGRGVQLAVEEQEPIDARQQHRRNGDERHGAKGRTCQGNERTWGGRHLQSRRQPDHVLLQ